MPLLWRYSAVSLRLKGGVKPPHSKAPFGRKAVPLLLGTPQAGLMLKGRYGFCGKDYY
jgi:hypothetical protein